MRTSIKSIGLKSHVEAEGISYEVIEAVMTNPLIIAKGAAIARATGKTHPTGKRWADQWIKEHEQENKSEEETS